MNVQRVLCTGLNAKINLHAIGQIPILPAVQFVIQTIRLCSYLKLKNTKLTCALKFFEIMVLGGFHQNHFLLNLSQKTSSLHGHPYKSTFL